MWRPNLKTFNECNLAQKTKIRSWVEVFANRGHTWWQTWKIISRWWYWLNADGEAFWKLRQIHEREFVPGDRQPKRKAASRSRPRRRRPKRRSARQRRQVASPTRAPTLRRQSAAPSTQPIATTDVGGIADVADVTAHVVNLAIQTSPLATTKPPEYPNALNPQSSASPSKHIMSQ